MTSPSKRKGNGFESDTAKFFNKIFNCSEFARSPGSGSWMGKSNAIKRKGIAIEAQMTLRGDLITPSDFPFIVECKVHSTNPIYHQMIANNDIKLDEWIKQVEYDSEQDGSKYPLLTFKSPRKGIFFAIPKTFEPIHQIINQIDFYVNYKQYYIISNTYFEQFKDFFYKTQFEPLPEQK